VRQQPSFLSLAKRSFAFWFGGIWFFVGAPFLIAGIYVGVDTIGQQERFKNEAQVAEGMVLNKWISRRRDSQQRTESTSYWVGYRFSAPNGSVVKREAQVSGELWDRFVEREPIRVTFLPSDPQTNRIEGESSAWMLPLIFTGLGLVFVPIGGFIFFKGVAGIRRELKLRDDGAMVEATVVEVRPANVSFNGVPQWRIRYRYQDHSGRTHGGESNVMAPEEAQAWKAGDKGTAHFDSEAPRKSIWVGKA
jgi:hypothetical protein